MMKILCIHLRVNEGLKRNISLIWMISVKTKAVDKKVQWIFVKWNDERNNFL